MEYYSEIKRNEIELFVVRWMDLESVIQCFPGGAVVENLPARAGDTGSGPALG